ncbi:Uncharacterized protein TPAR_03920 [Tolypocladium paradoxum]|uniref:Uncharacterized protein n=1 Tax=Tolypocladium paradoxum TaxID=94208 RepID=A0A2S4L0C1_9HYPO|nr:Uncharacterized protein TPAR_03920 [Tolypocladium paradoxum]
MPEDDGGGERSRLLSPRREDAAHGTADNGKRTATQRIAVLITCLAMLLAVEIGGVLSSTALMQIQEGIVCRGHHADVDRPSTDPRCKDAEVQADFAMLQGWDNTFALIPGLLLSMPYGMAADKYGRRIVLGLSLFGMTLLQGADITICLYPHVFPIRLIWLGALFPVVGGGPFVMMAVLTAIANDVSTDDQSPVTYLAMQRDVWFSVFLGFGIMCLSVLVALAIPETRGKRTAVGNTQDADGDAGASVPGGSLTLHWLRSRVSATVKELATSTRVLFWGNKSLGLLLGSFVFTNLGKSASAILMQYAAKRFGWSWSQGLQAGLLLSIGAFAGLIACGIILPVVSQLLAKASSLTPLMKDLWLARGSILLLVTGSFGLGLAPTSSTMIANLVLYSLGTGYGAAIRSLLTGAVHGEHTGLLYAMMSFLENTGSLIAGPLLALTFRVGLDSGGVWIGLPFIGAGFLFSLAAAIVFGVGLGALGAA